jgi:amino acid adenylation domain-containing protein/thioester reductase-like protein
MTRSLAKPPARVDACFHELFQAQARSSPKAPAICAWDGRMTYGQLNRSANRLARYLVDKHDTGVGDTVHLCFEKSLWHFVAMLAVNKAGAAWSPLDASHPHQRNQSIVEQTGSRLVLSSSKNQQACLDLGRTVAVVGPDLDGRLASVRDDINVQSKVTPRDPVYILFTSGSTGTPKGFIMEHDAACTSQLAIGHRLGMNPSVRMLQFASHVFDATVGESFMTLIAGASICIPSEEERMNSLADFVRREKVTWAILTPAVARTMTPEEFPTMELLVLCGEAASRDLLETWLRRNSVRLFNGWGPAETCVFSTLHQWTSKNESPLILGHPVGGRCWIVDPEDPRKLAPWGCVGEIVIQGPTLLRGYLGNEEQDRKVFVKPLPGWAPNRHVPGWDRMYRSGDLAKFGADGRVEFIARKDTQVKIRGLRIELGEIEHHVQELMPAFQQVAVEALHLNDSKNRTLVAYVSYTRDMREGLTQAIQVFMPVSSRLRESIITLTGQLKVALPHYMVPSVFIPCRIMPSNTSTKLDRKVLRVLTGQLSQRDIDEYAMVNEVKRPPETDAEVHIQAIWASLFNMLPESIGIDDSFFSIGGDSVMAIHFVSLARKMGIEVSVKNVFDDPRLHAVAKRAVTVGFRSEEEQLQPFDLIDEDTRKATEDEVLRHMALGTGGAVAGRLVLDNAFPVTPLQQGLMALSIKQPRSYIAKWVFRLHDSVCEDRFIKAWNKTVRLCPSLRTRIIEACNTTIQAHIGNDTQWEVTEGMQVQDFIREANTMNMTFGSRLSRWGLTRNRDGSRHFVLVAHHASYDGWTLRLVLSTLNSLYRDIEASPNLRPFDSFIKHIRIEGKEAESIEYWTNQLQDAQPTVFPARPSTAVTAKPASSRDITQSFTPPSRCQGSVTLATLVRASWAFLLSIYGETGDVCFGASVSGRQAAVAGISDMPGPVVATVPVRIRIQPEQKISEFLQQVQAQATDMIPYEQFGLQNIAKIGPVAKEVCDLSSLLVVQPYQNMFRDISSSDSASDSILTMEKLEDEDGEASSGGYFTMPLVVQTSISDEVIQIHITFDANIVSKPQATAIVHQLEHLVTSFAQEEHSDKSLSEISTAGLWDHEFARQQNSRMPTVVDSTFPEMFAKQVALQPNAMALRSREGEMTYGELDEISDRLAWHLVSNGTIHRHDLVLVCFEKSIWHVVSILAINKAGAAWVPLEPSYPHERLRQIARQSNASLALTSPQHAQLCRDLVPSILEVSPVFINTLGPHGILPMQPSPEDAIYVLFTSGSTGTPKGLVMEHRSVCTAMADIANRVDLGPGVNVLQFAAFVFDLSIGEILGPLIAGATICIPTEQDRTDDISSFIREFDVSSAYLTPSFTRTLQPSDVPSLKLLLWAGEATSQDLLDTWIGSVRLFNGWGPAETCCLSSIHEWTERGESAATIGRPVGGFCWIVDPKNHMRLAPVGTVGEVVVQGPTVLREYLDDAEKTSKAVFPASQASWSAPSPTSHWGRLFKSGDLCRYHPDGTMEFCGRKDKQVKIRGMRVELGEVEHHFRACLSETGADDVQVAADLVRRDGSEQLVIFFESGRYHDMLLSIGHNFLPLDRGLRTKLKGIINSLHSVLPRHMIPSLFILCNRLPVMKASTKLDRSALKRSTEALTPADLESFSLTDVRSRRAPETKTEELLQEIWADILNVPKDTIGTDDGFYHIGGDSIAIIRLVKRVEQQFRGKYNARVLGETHSTISSMARLIDGSSEVSSGQSLDIVSEAQTITSSLEPALVRLLGTPTVPRFEGSESSVLVTGASGYLGAEIVRKLLDDPMVGTVVAHVRAKSPAHGLSRIKEAAELGGWWSQRHEQKLEIWLGDLQEDRIVLRDDQWRRVCGQADEGNIDAIIHNGASVNWNLDYHSMRQINVGSVVALLEAAMASPALPRFVFVSGGGSFASYTNYLEDELVSAMKSANGYVQTKYVCDIVIRNIMDRLPLSQNRIAVVKPGRIIGSKASNSIANTDDYLWRVVAGAVSMGMYPTSDLDQWILVADTATVADTIISKIFADSHEKRGAYEDMVIGMPTMRFWELVNAQLDMTLTPVAWEEWIQQATEKLENGGERHPLFSIQQFLISLGIHRPDDGTNAPEDEITPYLEDAVIENVRYLNRIGYLQRTIKNYVPVEDKVVKRSAAFKQE